MQNKKINPNVAYELAWQNKFNELCFHVFYKNKQGAELLALLENKYFRSPVAYPNQEPSWAFFNEGKNELIRSFTAGIQAYMNTQNKSAEPKEIKREKNQ